MEHHATYENPRIRKTSNLQAVGGWITMDSTGKWYTEPSESIYVHPKEHPRVVHCAAQAHHVAGPPVNFQGPWLH